jgi:D-xylose transport system ATP-binding protein
MSVTSQPLDHTARDVVLQVDAISKYFGSITALQGASLSLHVGEVTALVGDNGAGKSTLVKIISGVLQADDGTLAVDGKRVELRDPRVARQHGIHTVFQDLGLVGSLSIVENLFLGTELRVRQFGVRTPWLDRQAMAQETRRALGNLGITTVSNVHSRVETLSGGQRQSVAIARAVREKARLVILDEPTAALGVQQAAQVLALIGRLKAAGTSVLVVSHNLREVFAVSDRVIVMRLGAIVEEFVTANATEEEIVRAIVGARVRGGNDGV